MSEDKNIVVQPGFGAILRGIFLLNWTRNLALRRLPMLVATAAGFPVLAYYACRHEGPETYLIFAIQFYLLLLLPIYCLYSCGGMIRDEVQADTLGFLITRPLTRAQLFLASYVSQMAWIQIVALINGLLLILAGWLREVPHVFAIGGLLLAAQALAVLVYCALSSLLGLIHQRYLVFGVVYGFIVEIGIGRIPTNINALSMSHHVQTVIANVQAVRDQFTSWEPQGTGFAIFMMFLATVLFLFASSILFTYREYHHSEEMQK